MPEEVWKKVKLKDPVTGEYLLPVGITEGGDADTLQGQTVDQIVNTAVSEVSTQVSQKLDATIQVSYNKGV